MVATLLRWRMAQLRRPARRAQRLGNRVGAGDRRVPSEQPRLLPAVSPLQVPSLTFYDTPGEAVLLVLALGPLVAGGILVWTLFGASLDERRQMRWLA